MEYVPLQVISSYSLLKSPIKISDLVITAKDRGYKTMVLTDFNVMYGAVEFYDACVKNNIKPIIGLTLELNDETDINNTDQIILIAKNNIGYGNLMAISSEKMINDSFTMADLAGKLAGIAVIVTEQSGYYKNLISGALNEANDYLAKLLAFQSNNEVFVGISYHTSPEINRMVEKHATDLGVSVIAFQTAEYLNADDLFTKRVLQNINANQKMNDITTKIKQLGPNWLIPMADELKQFQQQQITAGIETLNQLISEVDWHLEKQTPLLPKFSVPNGMNSAQYLRSLSEAGLKHRMQQNNIQDVDKYQQRLERELSIIHQMGFDDYFLIVWDVIKYAHEHNILTGPGRGSAAGSLVSYCLLITNVDPIKYDLLFERFLNPERHQMPDIDIDLPDNKRDQVINYMHHRYGDDHVAQIITFGTLAAKQAIKDVSKTFGLTPVQQSVWSQAFPANGRYHNLAEAYANSQKLKNLVADSTLNAQIFRTAQKIEGLPRHFSTHAAGLVLSQQSLVKQVPLQPGNEGLLMTQYSKNYVELVGLLKIDFLGLRNLTLLADVMDNIKQSLGHQIDLNQIPLDDATTISLFSNGKTNGIFQFESQGIRQVLVDFQPTNFADIVLINALYRPGPIDNISLVIERKRQKQAVTFNLPVMKQILQPTYGIIVYQEQVMQVASALAGFSLGQADILRRAMSKKKLQEIDDMKTSFIEGAKHRDVSSVEATQVFDYIEKFANYGFNKSHAVAYSIVAFQEAYLKVHYPQAFYTALLNFAKNDGNKIKQYLVEIKALNISVTGPNINLSENQFTITDNQIVFGLGVIKGLRKDFVAAILQERQNGGPYKSFANFMQRLPEKYRQEELLKPLIYVGAFDEFGFNRAELIAAVPEFISSTELSGNSIELLQILAPQITRRDDFSLTDKLEKENEYLGAYLSGHPVEKFTKLNQQFSLTNVADLVVGQKNKTILLYVSKIKTIRTKKGQQMAFLSGSDQTGDIEVTIFPKQFDQNESWLHKEMVIMVNGSVEYRQEMQFIANCLQPAENVARKIKSSAKQQTWFIRITDMTQYNQAVNNIAKLGQGVVGNTSVIIFEANHRITRKLNARYDLRNDEQTNQRLKELFGENNVILQ
ncbi:DNA polymerase III subunit alpha [Lentilactobacillus kribbianus]|uniref:DNA polymerase III subunit alpha n=1 Tax=Lentilactobacillus kribbianus TaxID=2729622 RepID=UPI00155555AC|nr:DNA polymerase III subunit alpha [Lentilactobacillus kribbianus]